MGNDTRIKLTLVKTYCTLRFAVTNRRAGGTGGDMHRVHLRGLPLDALRYGLVRAFHPGAEDVTVERIRSTFEQILGEREGTLAVTFAGDPTLAGSTSLLTIDLVSDEGPFDGTGWVERFDDLRETALELFKP